MIFLTIIVFILVFSALVLIHEFGHFFAAKKAGVKVEEFGFGLPPRIFGIKKGETLYSINLVPFGGFVRMLGEDASDPEAKKSKRSFSNQSLRRQAIIVCAGVFMNLFLAFVLLTFGFLIGIEPLIVNEEDIYNGIRTGQVEIVPGPAEKDETAYINRFTYLEEPDSIFSGKLQNGDVIIKIDDAEVLEKEDLYSVIDHKSEIDLEVYREGTGVLQISDVRLIEQNPVIAYLEENSPAMMAGLKIGDEIISINGESIFRADSVSAATAKVQKTVHYELKRGLENISLDIVLRDDGRIGIGISDKVENFGNLSLFESYVRHKLVKIHEVKYGVAAPVQAVKEMWRLGKLTATMFIDVLGKFVSGSDLPEGVAGPVGIAQMTFIFLQDGFAAMIRFVALLSLSLGVINILPIPALDGGRFLFIFLQILTGKKPNPRIEGYTHAAGFIFMLLFIAYITFNDVLRLF